MFPVKSSLAPEGEPIGFELDKKNIRLKNPIRTTGEYDVEVWVHQQVTSEVHISVVAE